MSRLRLLFASIHCYLDPSGGAALSTRELLELLAARGWDCRVLCCGVFDYQRETTVDEVLAGLGLPARRLTAVLGPGESTVKTGSGTFCRNGPGGASHTRFLTPFSSGVVDLEVAGVRVTVLPTASSRAERAPDRREGGLFLNLAGQVLDRFRPHVFLTYGGHPASLELMRRARTQGTAVVFHLHNFGYNDGRAFADASAVIFPSEYARQFYRRCIGLDGTVIPDPIRLDRVMAVDPQPTYLTFVNPQPEKGMTVFARIALELGRRRPEIPLLVVEGRGISDGLARVPADLSGLTNLNRMAHTTDPRDFYRVARAVLLPSLWRESLGRVAIEAMANRIPVLASDRGALPETLGDAGFVFTVPERCTPSSMELPTAREVAPWVATIEKLWDDAEFEKRHRELALRETRRWDSGRLVERFDAFLRMTASQRGG
jgi:glycosyltransferase involved in cell wall biosynthesis